MDRRSFLAWSALSPVSVAAGLAKHRRYRQPAPHPSGDPVPTGLTYLDDILRGGLTPGSVTLVGVTPGRAMIHPLTLTILDHRLQHGDGPVGFATAFLSRQAVTHRLATIRSGVDSHVARRGLWRNERERTAYEQARRAAESSPLHYESIRRLRPLADLTRSLLELHRSHPLDLVVIDDVGGLKDLRCAEDRERAAADVGRRLRRLARSVGAPILAVCWFAWVTQLSPLSDDWPVFVPPGQTELGPMMPVLDFCDAFLVSSPLPLRDPRFPPFAINVSFHPRTSTGCSSCHTIDRLTWRLEDGA